MSTLAKRPSRYQSINQPKRHTVSSQNRFSVHVPSFCVLALATMFAFGCSKTPVEQAEALAEDHKWVAAYDLLAPLAVGDKVEESTKIGHHNLCMKFVRRTARLYQISKPVTPEEAERTLKCVEFIDQKAVWALYLEAADGEDGGDTNRRVEWLGLWIKHRIRIDDAVAESVKLAKATPVVKPPAVFFARVADKIDRSVGSCMTITAWAARSGDLKTAGALLPKCSKLESAGGPDDAARVADHKATCAALATADKAFKCPVLAQKKVAAPAKPVAAAKPAAAPDKPAAVTP